MSERVLLFDIEGTTTSISFVHEVLFPYAREHLPRFIAERIEIPAVARCLREVQDTAQREEGVSIDTDGAVELLLRWVQADRKHPALKQLQGMLWREGYEQKAYVADLYPDVLPAWRRWHKAGMALAIFSSGSVEAQCLLFQHTAEGDVTALISHYFDLATGGKRETETYRRIAEKLRVSPASLTFFSDVTEELAAARKVGCEVVHVVRPGTEAVAGFPSLGSFADWEAPA